MQTLIAGDIQGCFGDLMLALARAHFNPACDRLWALGDLVNRGPESLATLRFFHQLGERAQIVLGNHDLHLLAVAEGIRPLKKGDTLQAILDAPDAAELLDWLRRQPLLWADPASGSVLVHAGIPPLWDLATAQARAAEVETRLQGPDYRTVLAAMYGNQPDGWQDGLPGTDRLRVIINYFTRMRFCTADGRLELQAKGPPEDAPAGFAPWYTHANADLAGRPLFFGHWAALMGRCTTPGWQALDTGCVWGEHLSLYRLEDGRTIRSR